MSYGSIEAMKAANEAAGFTWFGDDEMRMFGTKIMLDGEVIGGCLFVTYDTDGRYVGGFTIRECDGDGDVHTCRDSDGLCGYPTAGKARSAAGQLIADRLRADALSADKKRGK